MLGFELRYLEYFVTAASAGSYSQAARQLFVSPQAVSKGVQILEGRIGVALFDRGPNGISLTSFGETFFQEAVVALRALEDLQELAKLNRMENAGSLCVGIHSLCFKEHGGTIAWKSLLEFHEAHKESSPCFVEMRGDSIIESITSETLDLGIGVLPSQGLAAFEGILLRLYPIAALVSRNNGDFSAHDAVTVEELARSQLILLSEDREFNNFFVERAKAQGLCVDVSPLQIRADSDIGVVIDRNLYAIRPYQHAVRTTKGSNTRVLPVFGSDGSPLEMPLHLFWKKHKKLTPLETSFVDMVIALYR